MILATVFQFVYFAERNQFSIKKFPYWYSLGKHGITFDYEFKRMIKGNAKDSPYNAYSACGVNLLKVAKRLTINATQSITLF